MRISDALLLHLTQLRADGRSPHTIAQHQRHVRLFIAHAGDIDVAQVTHEHVARFCASEALTKRSDGKARRASSANALRSSIKGFLRYVHEGGFAATNSGRLIRRARCPPPRPRALTDAEVELLRAHFAKARTRAERRDRVLGELLLATGIRVGSAVGLDVTDVHGDELRLRSLKNGGESVVYLSAALVEILRAHIDGRVDGPLFPGRGAERLCARQIARRIEVAGRRAGIAHRVSCHALRRTFGTRIFAKTNNVFLTARALGHRGLGAVNAYVQVDEAALRAVVAV